MKIKLLVLFLLIIPVSSFSQQYYHFHDVIETTCIDGHLLEIEEDSVCVEVKIDSTTLSINDSNYRILRETKYYGGADYSDVLEYYVIKQEFYSGLFLGDIGEEHCCYIIIDKDTLEITKSESTGQLGSYLYLNLQ